DGGEERAVALEETQEETEPEREGEERYAEPRRIGQEQSHPMPHRALAARQGEDGAEDGADARCPSNGEGQAHREGSDEAGGLVPDLELPSSTQRAPLEDAGGGEAEEDEQAVDA